MEALFLASNIASILVPQRKHHEVHISTVFDAQGLRTGWHNSANSKKLHSAIDFKQKATFSKNKYCVVILPRQKIKNK